MGIMTLKGDLDTLLTKWTSRQAEPSPKQFFGGGFQLFQIQADIDLICFNDITTIRRRNNASWFSKFIRMEGLYMRKQLKRLACLALTTGLALGTCLTSFANVDGGSTPL